MINNERLYKGIANIYINLQLQANITHATKQSNTQVHHLDRSNA